MEEKSIHNLYPQWRIVRKIGSGSFGTVYEIERELFGKTEKAALKCITIPQNDSDLEELYGSGYDDASITAQFESYLSKIVGEYSIMAEMKGHSNVVYCDDISYAPRENGIGWDIVIKMELLTPLLKTLEAEIDEEVVVRLAKDLCRALILCQEKGVVHRDIKPQNIFVSKTGDYKLGDFGIAKTVEQTTGGTKIGTYNYMAPEVYNNQPYGCTADVYSLGLVMYWLLNNRRLPFLPAAPRVPTVSENDAARLRRFKGEVLPPPKNGSDGLKRIVLKACEFNPKDRFSAAQMLEALSALDDPAALNALLMQKADHNAVDVCDGGTEVLFDSTDDGGTVHLDNTISLTEEETVVVPPSPEPDNPRKKTKIIIAFIAAGLLMIALLCILPLILGRSPAPEVAVNLPETALMGVEDRMEMPFEVQPEAEEGALHWACSDEAVVRIDEGTLVGQGAGSAEITLTYQDASDSCQIFVFGRSLGDQLHQLTSHDWYYAADDLILFRIDGEDYLYDGARPIDELQQSKLALAAAQELGEYTAQDRNAWLDVSSDADGKTYLGSVVWAENAAGTSVIVVYDGNRAYLLDPEKLEDPADVTLALVLSESELTLEVEETAELGVKVIQADGSEAEPEGLEWSSSDAQVCSVENGILTALKEGKAEITVKNGQVSASCQVTVTAPAEEPTEKETEPPKQNQGNSGNSGNSGGTKPKPTDPTVPTPTTPKPTEPPATKPTDPPATKPTTPPATEPAPTDPPVTEPVGKAPAGYSISLSTSSIILYETFTVRVVPDVTDYTKIVIHAIDPTGGRWDFTMSGTNSKSLYVDDPNLVGTWKIYADVYNQYGVYYGSSNGPYATIRVIG